MNFQNLPYIFGAVVPNLKKENSLVRLNVGLEAPEDLIADLRQAMAHAITTQQAVTA